jgi:cell division protein FtsX
LPPSYEVRLHAASAGRAGVEDLVDRLRKPPGVSDVRYDRQWLERLLAAVTIVRVIGLVLGTVLTVAASLTVANASAWPCTSGATKSRSCNWLERR